MLNLMSVASKLPECDTAYSYVQYANSLDLYGLSIVWFSLPYYVYDIEQLITSEKAELILNGGTENAGCTFKT